MIADEGSLAPIEMHHVPDLAIARHAHLVGIAGAGMRALAEVLLGRGWQLSGSDPSIDAVQYLATRNVRLHDHHAADNLPADCAVVVHSDAIGEDNPELVRAAERGIPRHSYFQVLGQLMSTGTGLAVAGTHGKSTTTAMAAQMLVQAGLDPTVLCGATPLGQPSGGRAGRSDLMVAEACEYNRNFLNLGPRHAVILGIEPDHFDCYDSLSDLEDAFARFARRVPPGGLILAAADCPVTRRVVADVPSRVETFGLDGQADWLAHGLSSDLGKYRFEIRRLGRPVCEVSLPVPGRHNVLNALAAAALAWHNGVAGEQIARSLADLPGLKRRFETLASGREILMIDDYAHHPTEVVATLQAVRQVAPQRRVWCVFQPHQASRTERLLDELA
ncbi:MAG TPA: UDP-N-acetylmuramate--L-alanine ligase, partial [Thermoguttaceae bacterium]|nr:UDP-N-acetylmuramate--L-alanine ligase [Thermoguttaceae bacterium]